MPSSRARWIESLLSWRSEAPQSPPNAQVPKAIRETWRSVCPSRTCRILRPSFAAIYAAAWRTGSSGQHSGSGWRRRCRVRSPGPMTNSATAAPSRAMAACAAKVTCSAPVRMAGGWTVGPPGLPPSATARALSSATSTARPTDPPICWAVEAIAEATPCSPRATPVPAATYMVVKATPCPSPATIIPGSRMASDGVAGSRRYRASPTAPKVMPAASVLEIPTRPTSLPPTCVPATTDSTSGRKLSPAFSGAWPSPCWRYRVRKKSCNPNEDMNAAVTSTPPRTVRIRSSRSGISGDRERSSTTTNAASRTRPMATPTSVRTDVHPCVGAETRLSTIAIAPSVTSSAPGRSKRRAEVAGSRSGSTSGASSTSAAVTGTFTKNTAGQPNSPVSTPPASTPSDSPPAPADPHTAIARLRSRPSSKVVFTRERVAGNSTAPPMPCTARAAISRPACWARPPAGEAKGPADVGQRHVDDRVVECDDELGGRQDREGGCLGAGTAAAAGLQREVNVHASRVPRRRSDVVAASAHLSWTLAGVSVYRLAGRRRWALVTTTDGEPAAKLNAMTSRCLIVDDSTRFLQVARRVLEGDDVTVVGVATSIAEALDLAGRLQPDVVLVDIGLAGESGFELARRLHEQPGATDPQVILISTHDPEDFAELIAASPVVGFVAKAELSGRAILDLL